MQTHMCMHTEGTEGHTSLTLHGGLSASGAILLLSLLLPLLLLLLLPSILIANGSPAVGDVN